jgi:hypothetical protein
MRGEQVSWDRTLSILLAEGISNARASGVYLERYRLVRHCLVKDRLVKDRLESQRYLACPNVPAQQFASAHEFSIIANNLSSAVCWGDGGYSVGGMSHSYDGYSYSPRPYSNRAVRFVAGTVILAFIGAAAAIAVNVHKPDGQKGGTTSTTSPPSSYSFRYYARTPLDYFPTPQMKENDHGAVQPRETIVLIERNANVCTVQLPTHSGGYQPGNVFMKCSDFGLK